MEGSWTGTFDAGSRKAGQSEEQTLKKTQIVDLRFAYLKKKMCLFHKENIPATYSRNWEFEQKSFTRFISEVVLLQDFD